MKSLTIELKEILINKGIKQTWLAEKLGKSFTIVNSYVCNRRQPSLELLLFGGELYNFASYRTNARNYL